jgi:hypothetical protein
MSIVTLNNTLCVSLEEAEQLILNNRDVCFFLEGEPGMGKTSLKKRMQAILGDTYDYCYLDCAATDFSGVGYPGVDREKGIAQFFPMEVLKLHTGKPVFYMLDEFTKAPGPVQTMLHTMLESNDRRVGDRFMHKDSIVTMSGNLSGNALGDVMKAHTGNRVIRLLVRKSTSDEWIRNFAIPAGIEPVLMAWVKENAHCMASYLDGNQDGNPYIFNPKFQQRAFVSGRSLERASGIVRNREGYSTNALTVALAGCVGEAAGKSIEAFVAYQDELPPREVILRDPKGAPLPTTPGACAVMVFSAIAALDKNNATPLMTYIQRLSLVWQACFTINAARDPIKRPIVCSNVTFANWLRENQDLL